jgi:hypothetical protein
MMALLFALVTASPVLDQPKLQTPTVEYILSLKPGLGQRQAKRLGRIIDRWALKYEVDPSLIVAIIRQESNFEPSLKSCWPAPWKSPEAVTCDHGLTQINETWVRKWNLDADKLVTDDEYNVAVAARILAILHRYYGQEPEWYGRYHSSTPSKKRQYLSQLALILAWR